MAHSQLSILNVHTPTSSFAILHSLNQEDLTALFDKLNRKVPDGQCVKTGWLKYEYNGVMWDLDDDSDYKIFTWRQQQHEFDLPTPNHSDIPSIAIGEPGPSKLLASVTVPRESSPTLYLHNPTQPLPAPTAYRNPSFYAFHPILTPEGSPAPSTAGRCSRQSKKDDGKDGVPKLVKQFEKFHSQNGVRTVMGSIGPVKNVRMLLKVGYRHVYMSRRFAQKHGFVPRDATPGNYGYAGLVNIGTWPITLMTSACSVPAHTDAGIAEGESLLRAPAKIGPPIEQTHGHERKSSLLSYQSKWPSLKSFVDDGTVTNMEVYLAEEEHFDVVLGRSFIEKRKIKTNFTDPTEVVCLDTGEKIECELVILKDGRGEIVTVT